MAQSLAKRQVTPAARGLSSPLARYRVMAYVVGVGLIVLVLVGMPLKYGAHFDAVVAVVGPVHGVLYIVYLLTALDLARTYRMTVLRLLAMVGAGLLPFLAFYVERRITRQVEGQQAHQAAGARG